MEPAPIGEAKDGAAGSVIVEKRRDSRVQRRASSAAAADILQQRLLGGCAVFCAVKAMNALKFLRLRNRIEAGYANTVVN